MDYRIFLARLADIFDRTLADDADDFTITPGEESGEWDSLATLATIALLHEAFGRKFPLKALQSCSSAKDVYRLAEAETSTESREGAQ